jgi:hypothetical protein
MECNTTPTWQKGKTDNIVNMIGLTATIIGFCAVVRPVHFFFFSVEKRPDEHRFLRGVSISCACRQGRNVYDLTTDSNKIPGR